MDGTRADCIFCRIAAGEIPAKRVAETGEVLAFRDTNPQAPTHVLLIPQRHVVASAAELGAGHGALLGELFALAVSSATRKLLKGLAAPQLPLPI